MIIFLLHYRRNGSDPDGGGTGYIQTSRHHCYKSGCLRQQHSCSLCFLQKNWSHFEKKVISEGTIKFFERENADVLAYKRIYQEEELVVFNNLTGGKVVLQAKPEWKTYHKLLGNYDKEYEIENEGEIVLEPYETLVLEK